ncbi:MAG: HAD-IA family hydrolase [Patescibacteria group bacterium]
MPAIILPNDLKVVFDLDDTLIMTMVKFNRTAVECGSLIIDALGWYAPYAPDLFDLQVRIDIELTSTLGFGPQKFATCWLQTYEMLCNERGLIPSDTVKYRLQRIAMKPFIGPSELVPGAKDTIIQLHAAGYQLFMCTMGERNVQLTKLISTGLKDYFRLDRVHATTRSKVDVLREIAADSPELTVMVGDSKKSDIKAAQEVGAQAIHVECPTQWSYNHLDDTELGPYWHPPDISGVPAVLDRIRQGEKPV